MRQGPELPMAKEGDDFIDLLEAVRLIMRAKTGRDDLAAIASDEWIRGARYRFVGHRDESQWKLLGEAVEAFREARGWLRATLAQGVIETWGKPAGSDGRRRIGCDEWSTLHIRLFDPSGGALVNKAGAGAGDFPPIQSLRISVRDLTQALSAAGLPAPPGRTEAAAVKGSTKDHRTQAIAAMLQGLLPPPEQPETETVKRSANNLGEQSLAALAQKKDEPKIVEHVEDKFDLVIGRSLLGKILEWSRGRF